MGGAAVGMIPGLKKKTKEVVDDVEKAIKKRTKKKRIGDDGKKSPGRLATARRSKATLRTADGASSAPIAKDARAERHTTWFRITASSNQEGGYVIPAR